MTVPFNLSAFDESTASDTPGVLSRTATRVQEVCHPLLYKPSKEGEYAALALARLYARPDCKFALKPFLGWIRSELDKQDTQDDGLEAIFVSRVSNPRSRCSLGRMLIVRGKSASECLVVLGYHSWITAFSWSARTIGRPSKLPSGGAATQVRERQRGLRHLEPPSQNGGQS